MYKDPGNLYKFSRDKETPGRSVINKKKKAEEKNRKVENGVWEKNERKNGITNRAASIAWLEWIEKLTKNVEERICIEGGEKECVREMEEWASSKQENEATFEAAAADRGHCCCCCGYELCCTRSFSHRTVKTEFYPPVFVLSYHVSVPLLLLLQCHVGVHFPLLLYPLHPIAQYYCVQLDVSFSCKLSRFFSCNFSCSLFSIFFHTGRGKLGWSKGSCVLWFLRLESELKRFLLKRARWFFFF